MDAYLKIAAAVLRLERRPLSSRSILVAAYRRGIVPSHLYGKTQHKTLQARLSEDIVLRNDRSLFFRTEPGRFFLREFITDSSLPIELRRPIPTRRRSRELVKGQALAMHKDALSVIANHDVPINPNAIFSMLHEQQYVYSDPRQEDSDRVYLRSFVCVIKNNCVLSYRQGRYREDRDAFMSRRSIGFSTFIYDDDRTLFNYKDFGIVDAGVQAVIIDLDVPSIPIPSLSQLSNADLSHFLWVKQPKGSDALLAIVVFNCPEWFEPVKRRLALNDLQWIPLDRTINNWEDYDPWSKVLTSSSRILDCEEANLFASSQSHHRRSSSQISAISHREWRSRTG